jgi:hypothetical protein
MRFDVASKYGTPIFLGYPASLMRLSTTIRKMYSLAKELRVHRDLVKPQFL